MPSFSRVTDVRAQRPREVCKSCKVPEEALQRSPLLANVVLGLDERAEPLCVVPVCKRVSIEADAASLWETCTWGVAVSGYGCILRGSSARGRQLSEETVVSTPLGPDHQHLLTTTFANRV